MKTVDFVEPPSPDEALSVIAHLFCSLMTKLGVPWNAIIQVVNSTEKVRNLAEYIIEGCPSRHETDLEISNQDDCRSLLGDSFISIEDVQLKMGLSYSPSLTGVFNRNIPGICFLAPLRERKYFLLPGPSSDQTFFDLVNNHRIPVLVNDGEWFLEEEESFAKKDTVRSRVWMAIKTNEITDSLRKSWECQIKIIGSERPANSAEILWAMSVIYLSRNITIFDRIRVRSSSLASNGNRVTLGFISQNEDDRGAFIRIGRDTSSDDGYPNVGIPCFSRHLF